MSTPVPVASDDGNAGSSGSPVYPAAVEALAEQPQVDPAAYVASQQRVLERILQRETLVGEQAYGVVHELHAYTVIEL